MIPSRKKGPRAKVKRFLRLVVPKGIVPQHFVLCVGLMSIAFVCAEGYIMYLTKVGKRTADANIWRIEEIQKAVSTSMETYTVYSVIYILAQCFMLALCWEAVVTENAMQIVAAIVFYFTCLVYAATRYVSFYIYPSLTARLFYKNRNMYSMQICVIVMYSVSLVILGVMYWRLKSEVGWSNYKRFGADVVIHRAYKWNQNLTMILKLDAFFVLSYLIQMSMLILKLNSAENWIQVTVFIPVSVTLIALSLIALHNEMRLMMMGIVSLYGALLGYLVYRIVRVCSGIGEPENPYEDSRPYMMVSISILMLLIITTIVVSVFCIRSFGLGLKEAIRNEKHRRKIRQIYRFTNTNNNNSSEESLGLLSSARPNSPRTRFALE